MGLPSRINGTARYASPATQPCQFEHGRACCEFDFRVSNEIRLPAANCRAPIELRQRCRECCPQRRIGRGADGRERHQVHGVVRQTVDCSRQSIGKRGSTAPQCFEYRLAHRRRSCDHLQDSAVAVCCSSASEVAGSAAPLNSRAFSMAITAWLAKVANQFDLFVGEWSDFLRGRSQLCRSTRLRAASDATRRRTPADRLARHSGVALKVGLSSPDISDLNDRTCRATVARPLSGCGRNVRRW